MARPGSLTHRVRVLVAARQPDGQGGFTTSEPAVPAGWPDTVAAEVRALSGSERLRQGNVQATASHKVTVRYLGELSTDATIEVLEGRSCVGETFSVTFAGDPDGRGEWLEIMAVGDGTSPEVKS